MEVGVSAQASPTLLVHGWADDPREGWFGWLQAELKKSGRLVQAPYFDRSVGVRKATWLTQLADAYAELARHHHAVDIVAHSLGCWLTLRLLEDLPAQSVGTVIMVAGFYDAPDERARHWFEPEPNWEKVRSVAQRFVCLYSDTDSMVTPDRTRRLAHQLHAEVVCLPDRGHFLRSEGTGDFPEILPLLNIG